MATATARFSSTTGEWRELGKFRVKLHDPHPFRLLCGGRSRVASGDGSLQCVWSPASAELSGAIERRETAPDEELIPARAVLIEQQNRLSRRANSRSRARRLNLHERDQPVNFRLLR